MAGEAEFRDFLPGSAARFGINVVATVLNLNCGALITPDGEKTCFKRDCPNGLGACATRSLNLGSVNP